MLEAGAQAPNFTLRNQDDELVSLSDFVGQRVVLYFYPRADSPGCTAQACGIRDHQADYDAAGAVILGVSTDDVPALKRFRDRHGLTFTLLSDADHAVAEAYGTWVEKTTSGKTSMGVQRATFIIDGAGTIAHVIPKASPKTHDDVLLKALGELATA